ncbi:MAG: kynureninase [Alphaproteobacteria bacterium]|nr:kynureninase [Alphaproteobacteria bacterium]MBU1512864.1 kynureninase [Alphaproteobacteria bacterium]MBU2096695.1 kynureninase [Alphaproteobacteria bacterium]MBU2150578.1 kynureninase [Alphaproteobacteria bacterium]MBU2308076.1 kynureninase [Alphaproteobacteria bacterium]
MNRADAETLDATDPLARFRDAFALPPGVIYLDGNSLGPLPRAAVERVALTVGQEWGQGLITSWNAAGWIEAPQRLGGKIARLIGAKANEVVVADSTSVNLFKLAAGALSLRPERRTLIIESGNFPTDVYVLEGVCALSGAMLKVLPPDEVLGAVDADTAAVVLTQVNYKTARRWDMAATTAAVQAKGALMLWDLCHSAGAVACDLNAANADLAVGCSYKYLNGGPGAPAFLFVAERHQAQIRSPLSGWMGHAAPFAFEDRYRPAADIGAMLCGTPPILGLAALEAGLDLQLEADPKAVEAKGLSLCRLFIDLVESRCAGHGLVLTGPRDMAQRGLHVSFAHPEGYGLVQAMIARGVIGDFREPDIARFGFSPLYLSHADVWDAVEILRDVLETKAFEAPEFRTRAAVT